jgi:hypothetical protein
MSVKLATANSEAAILSRVVEPIMPSLSPDTAKMLLKLKFSEEDSERMRELSLKAQEGTLTELEESELDNYRRVGHLIELLWSKARLSLKRSGNDS